MVDFKQDYVWLCLVFSRVIEADEIWVNMKNVHDSFGVKKMSDLLLKEIFGIYGTKDLTDEKTKNI